MRSLLNILTSRRTSLALMVFVAFFGALGAWIPQSPLGQTEALAIWREGNPLVARIADALGLFDIFSSWWFLTAITVFAVVLTIATLRLLRDAWRASRHAGRTPRTLLPGVELQPVLDRARAEGYRERASSDERYVLSRYGIGVWASAVLHVGILISLVWSALLLGTTTAVIADFSQGAVLEPSVQDDTTGDQAGSTGLGGPWRFDGMKVVVWPEGGLKEVSASLSFMDDDGIWQHRTSSVNAPLRIKGHTIYVQPDEFGDAAFLRFTDEAGAESRIRMEFYFTQSDELVYADEPYMIGDVPVEGRWDPHGLRDERPLGLRPAGDSTAEPITLAPGETASVAGLTVEFVGTAQWARFIVQSSPSIVPLLLGFGIIGLGSLMLYIWIPRELVVEATDDGVRYSWHAARMPRAYLHERDAILGFEATVERDA